MNIDIIECISYLKTQLDNGQIDNKEGYKEAILDLEMLYVEQKEVRQEIIQEINNNITI